MLNIPGQHVVTELFDRNIRGCYPGQHNQAQKCLFAKSLKCYRQDEYETIASDTPEDPDLALTDPPIYACKFGEGQNYGHILVMANEDGQIGLRDTRQIGGPKAVEGHQIHHSAIFDVSWVPGSAELVSVSADKQVAVLAVRGDGSLHAVQSLMGHTRSIKTVSVNPFDPCVIATGARDGHIIIWDKRCKPHHKADEIAPAHSFGTKSITSPSIRKLAAGGSASTNSVTCVLFQQQHTLVSAGSSDGLIKLWDLRKTHGGTRREPQCQSFLEHSGRSSHRGFTSIFLSPSQDVLYASCMDHTIYAYHLANPTPKPVAEYTGHNSLTYFVKSCISPCGSYLLSGSSDYFAYIWLTDRPGKPIAKLTGHSGEVTAVDWCPVDDEKVVTCADDMTLRIFRRRNTNMEDFDEKICIRGVSEPYVGENSEEKPSNFMYLRVRPRTSESLETLPPLPVTPSTSRSRTGNFDAVTPCGGQRSSSSTPQACPRTPQQHTPHHQGRGRVTPCTPKTSERNALLQWLVNSQTPRCQESQSTLRTENDAKKTSHKRKLTDLMGENQENVSNEDKPKSPNAERSNVLCPSSIMNSPALPVPSAAKMLKYRDDTGVVSSSKSREHDSTDIADSVKPIDGDDQLVSGFRKPVTNLSCRFLEPSTLDDSKKSEKQANSVNSDITTKCKDSQFGHFSTPTANLPNFIVDGTSPHSRPEIRIEKKRNQDWLTTFSHQRKLKFTKTPDKVKNSSASPKPFGSQKQSKIKVLKIKSK